MSESQPAVRSGPSAPGDDQDSAGTGDDENLITGAPAEDAAVDVNTPVRKGPLRPSELAEVAVLGDLGLVLQVIGWFMPIGVSGAAQALSVIPFAVLAARHRFRAAAMATVAASGIGALVGGLGLVIATCLAAALGTGAGVAYRLRWNGGRTILTTTVVVGTPVSALTLLLAASSGYRKLSFEEARIVWTGVSLVLKGVGGLLHVLGEWTKWRALTTGWHALDRLANDGKLWLAWAIKYWFVALPAIEFFFVFLIAIACSRLRPFLVEMERRVPRVVYDQATERMSETAGGVPAPKPCPVPVQLEGVTYRYPGRHRDAVAGVSLLLEPGKFLAIVGPNGSGKSTAVRLLAGRLEPAEGTVQRQGPAGLGLAGGTAMVFQRPEAQVLGVRVRDDVCWGLHDLPASRMSELLDHVGLGGFEDRDTSTMSGGELQRLAIAAALARSPQLLVSDEATAMIDRQGRSDVVALLRQLANEGISVIHVTHRPEEAAVADEIVTMRAGRIVSDDPGPGSEVVDQPASSANDQFRWALSPKPLVRTRRLSIDRVLKTDSDDAAAIQRRRETSKPLVELRQVGYIYAKGSPWAHRALKGVSLKVWSGEGLVITGPNGSGKSTLAWILAGLTPPTEGEALLDQRPIVDEATRVGIAFQHARLQLVRPTVLKDVALNTDEASARQALRTVGIDPDRMGSRRVDDLSGGEQRRVALAGILVRKPDLIVLDEPYAGLDDESRRALAAALRALRQASGAAVVVVTHDLDNADVLGDRLVTFQDGTIVSDGPLGGAP